MNDYKIIHNKINNKSGLSQIFDVVYGDGALNIKQSDAMTLIDSLDSGVIPVFRCWQGRFQPPTKTKKYQPIQQMHQIQ